MDLPFIDNFEVTLSDRTLFKLYKKENLLNEINVTVSLHCKTSIMHTCCLLFRSVKIKKNIKKTLLFPQASLHQRFDCSDESLHIHVYSELVHVN